MKIRRNTLWISLLTIVLLGAGFSRVVEAGSVRTTIAVKTNLANVRSYVATSTQRPK